MNRSFNPLAIVLIAMLLFMSVAVLEAVDVSNILDLWEVRDDLDGTYTQTANINLWVTNPDNISSWSADSTYAVGEIKKHTDGFAYYCEVAQGTAGTFSTDNWTKMWEASKGWEPIGFQNSTEYTNAFVGNYDGDEKTISNLFINRGAGTTGNTSFPSDGENLVGLFGFVSSNSTADNYIKNVKLTDVDVTGKRGTGSLIGKVMMPGNANHKTYTENCSVVGGTVSGFGATGGLVGANNSDRRQQVPVIQYCWSNVTVSSTHPDNVSLNSGDSNNPYNIKYGGIVGCNETGVTFDSYALGNVSGGDRVGGLAGCTIDGAIIRCYAIGDVTQNIASGTGSGTWEGGVGGITGRITGKLPPGLGGFKGSGSVQYSYYNSDISIISAGGPVLNDGATTSTIMTKVPIPTGVYENWDFTNVWSHVTNGSYPVFQGSTPPAYYYKSNTADGDWSNASHWRTAPSSEGSYTTTPTTYPDFTNSAGIIIDTNMDVDVDVSVDQMEVNSDKTLTIASGKKLYVSNNTEDNDLVNNGTITITGTLEVGQSAGFENKGTFNINGDFINSGTTTWTSGTPSAGSSSRITYNGAVAQTTGTGFPDPIQDMVIDNADGVTFSNAFTINGTLTINSGKVTGALQTDGYHSVALNRLEINESTYLISDFSAGTSTVEDNYPDFVKRQWTINGYIDDTTEANRVKALIFYWTADDDNEFDWSGIDPALFVGDSTSGITGTFTAGDPRKLEVNYTFPQTGSKNGAKETFKIGLSDGQTLPVELSSFTAIAHQSSAVKIQWTTQSETNVQGFWLYRNQSDELDSALRLGQQIPATNTSQAQYYVYIDRETPAMGTYYYWLESVDFDGSNTFYGPVHVNLGDQNQGSSEIPVISGIAGNYPNPFNPDTTIRFGVENNAHVSLEIFNVKGQTIRRLVDGELQPGWHQVIWDGRNAQGDILPNGVYFLRMNAGGSSYLHKTVLMK